MDPLNPRSGGDVRYLNEITSRLSRDGFEVSWIASRFPGSASREYYNGVEVVRTGNIYSVFFLHHLDPRVSQLPEPDLRIETLSSIPFLLRGSKRFKDVLVIHHIVPFSQMWRKVGPLAVLSFLLERLVAPAIYRDRRVMVDNDSVKQEVHGLGYHDVRIIRLGADSVCVDIGEKEPLIVAPGPVKPWKHHEDIIRAFSLVESDWKLAIFGSYESLSVEQRLKAVAKDCGVEERTLFMGWISDHDRADLLRRASLCALASEKEGWGLAAMEAQASGCPVVAYSVSGLRDSVEDRRTGLLVQPSSVPALAGALQKLIADKKLREQMALAAVSRVKGYDWESCYRDFRVGAGL